MDKFNVAKTEKQKEIEIRNKLLNSILDISCLENNDNLCDLLFSKSKTFINPFGNIVSLSYSEIIQKLLRFGKQKKNSNFSKILYDIFSNINYAEINDLFTYLQGRIFYDFICVDFFLSLLIEYFYIIKIKEQFIKLKILEMISELKSVTQKKEKIIELLKNEIFRKMVVKIIFLCINTKWQYNMKNSNQHLEDIILFLKAMNVEDENYNLLLNEVFNVFFIELYVIEYKVTENNILEKFNYIDSKNELSDLEIKPLDFLLFKYLERVIHLFCSLNLTINIINEIIYYLYQIQYSYYQIYLQEYRSIINNNIEIDKIQSDYVLCFFYHIFRSKAINEFFNYMAEYSKDNNSKIFELFPDFKRILINVFNLCPCPFYLNSISEIIKTPTKFKENNNFVNDLIEMIMTNESLELNNIKQLNNKNKYRNQFDNILILLKMFLNIACDSKFNDEFCQVKLREYFIMFRNILKKNNLIYSNFLITIEVNNEKVHKTILEIILIITYSFLSKNEKSASRINEYLKFFEIKKRGQNPVSLFIIFDMVNKNKINNVKDYKNEDFDNYLSELNCPKEGKSLLIISLIYFTTLGNKKSKMDNLQKFLLKYSSLIINEITIIFNKYNGLYQKTKVDAIYDLILDALTCAKGKKLNFDQKLISSIIALINKNTKKFKEYDSTNNTNQLNNDNLNECYLKNKCLLLKAANRSSLLPDSMKLDKKPIIFGDYFSYEIPNTIKHLKNDLLLKDCSIYFDSLYFNDTNFDIIKKSFLIKYKKNLMYMSDKKFFNYPCKIKNYSSNKYALPKIFLKYDTDYYKNIYFSKCHPDFNLELVKNDSFPNLPTHYEYYKEILNHEKYFDFNEIYFQCELISPKSIICGKICLKNKYILFENVTNFDENNLDYILNSRDGISFDKKIIIINYTDIEEIIIRTFVYNEQAFEIFLQNGKSYMFNLYQEAFLNTLLKQLESKIPSNLIIRDPKSFFEKNDFTKKWENNEISTYQYLLYINKYSGRTYNDLNQYPIFPWIFLETNFEKTKGVPHFRDMNYCIAAQSEKGKEKGKHNYITSMDKKKTIHHYLIHYSTAASIMIYLIKVSPFTQDNIKLQKGQFDSPNRLLYGIDSLITVLQNNMDNRELIPEYFTSADFFYNLNYIFFGK